MSVSATTYLCFSRVAHTICEILHHSMYFCYIECIEDHSVELVSLVTVTLFYNRRFDLIRIDCELVFP